LETGEFGIPAISKLRPKSSPYVRIKLDQVISELPKPHCGISFCLEGMSIQKNFIEQAV
jgi:hypothetical protein